MMKCPDCDAEFIVGWEEICDLISRSAQDYSKIGHSIDDNEQYPDSLPMQAEFLKNIIDYCENERRGLLMQMDDMGLQYSKE